MGINWDVFNPQPQQQGPPAPAQNPLDPVYKTLVGKPVAQVQKENLRQSYKGQSKLGAQWKNLERAKLSEEDLSLAKSYLFLSLRDKHGNEVAPETPVQDLDRYAPSLTYKDALAMLKDPAERGRVTAQRDAFRAVRKGGALPPPENVPPMAAGTPLGSRPANLEEQGLLGPIGKFEAEAQRRLTPLMNFVAPGSAAVPGASELLAGVAVSPVQLLSSAEMMVNPRVPDFDRNMAALQFGFGALSAMGSGGVIAQTVERGGSLLDGILGSLGALKHASPELAAHADEAAKMISKMPEEDIAKFAKEFDQGNFTKGLQEESGTVPHDPSLRTPVDNALAGPWRERTQAFINELQNEIDAGRNTRTNGHVKRQLQKSLDDGVPHPFIVDEINSARGVSTPETAAPHVSEPAPGLKQEPVVATETAPPAVEPPVAPEPPQTGAQPVETPVLEGAAKAKSELSSMWDEFQGKWESGAYAPKNLGAGAGSFEPTVELLNDLGKMALKAAEAGIKTAAEFAAKFPAEVRDHAVQAWEKAHGKPAQEDGAFGLATRFEPEGYELPKHGVTVEHLYERGRHLVESGKADVKAVYDRAMSSGHVTPDDISVAAYRGTQVKNRIAQVTQEVNSGTLDDVEKSLRLNELTDLGKEMRQVLEVGSEGQKAFHQTGQALQVALRPDYSLSEVLGKATAHNYGEPLAESVSKDLTEKSKALEDALAKNKDLETKLDKALKERTARSGGQRSANTAVRRKALVEGLYSDLGLGVNKPGGKGVAGGKTAGAVSVAEGAERRVTAKVNGLTKLYIDEGAKNLDDIVKSFIKDMPELTRDDVLSLLSGEYKKTALFADVKKLEIDRALRIIKQKAEYERKTAWQKFSAVAGDAATSLQRQMQSGLDTSLSFIQGMPGMVVSPSSWGKAWVPWAQSWKKGGIDAVTAALKRDPAYKYAVKDALKLREVDGALTKAEETMIGHLAEKAAESPVPVVKQYFGFLLKTQESGVAFINQLHLDLYKKFVAGRWSDPVARADAATLANVLTGRGSGKVADALSSPGFAYAAYAPRFGWSKFQNTFTPLMLPAYKTGRGKGAALSAWGKQAGVALAVPYIAKSLGMNADTDVRSANFGAVETPDGHQIRLFKSFTEPFTLAAQVVGGKIGKSGKYTPPGYASSQFLGQYIEGKGSPPATLAWDQGTGQRYDPKENKYVPFNMSDPADLGYAAARLFVPLSVQQGLSEADSPLGWLLNMMGIDYQRAPEGGVGKTDAPWPDRK